MHRANENRKRPTPAGRQLRWPDKRNLFGVEISTTNYDEAVDAIIESAQQQVPAVASFNAVHSLISASCDPQLRERLNPFQLAAPDGQPVRWALNLLHRAGLRDPVCGPDLMARLCCRAAEEGVPIYLYGGSPDVIRKLCSNLQAMYPGLQIARAESPPFRSLTAEEDDEMVRRINDSKAGILFIGLGCPKQEHFAYEHRHRIRAVQVCVGAAFDFHAGNKARAPRWMRRIGLEWLFRLCAEPRRLWRRYLVTNTIFLVKLAVALTRCTLALDGCRRSTAAVATDTARPRHRPPHEGLRQPRAEKRSSKHGQRPGNQVIAGGSKNKPGEANKA